MSESKKTDHACVNGCDDNYLLTRLERRERVWSAWGLRAYIVRFRENFMEPVHGYLDARFSCCNGRVGRRRNRGWV